MVLELSNGIDTRRKTGAKDTVRLEQSITPPNWILGTRGKL